MVFLGFLSEVHLNRAACRLVQMDPLVKRNLSISNILKIKFQPTPSYYPCSHMHLERLSSEQIRLVEVLRLHMNVVRDG